MIRILEIPDPRITDRKDLFSKIAEWLKKWSSLQLELSEYLIIENRNDGLRIIDTEKKNNQNFLIINKILFLEM